MTEIALTAEQARGLTDRIKTGAEAIWELIRQAYIERAWAALGYMSWDDYCTREFGTSRLRLPREERSEVVASLRESGLSIRAIAAATGDSRDTVHKALKSGVRNLTPDIAEDDSDAIAEELIGQQLPPMPKSYAPEVAAEPEAQPTSVIGVDGKRYRPKPLQQQRDSSPRRRPIVDTARDIGLDLTKLTRRLQDLAADDRQACEARTTDKSQVYRPQFPATRVGGLPAARRAGRWRALAAGIVRCSILNRWKLPFRFAVTRPPRPAGLAAADRTR